MKSIAMAMSSPLEASTGSPLRSQTEKISSPSKTFKLFFIVDNDEPHAGAGGFYALYKFAEFLARRGHRVCVFGVHDLGWVKSSPNLTLIFRPSLPRKRRYFAKIDRFISKVSDGWLLPKAVKEFQPDWIIGVLTYSAIKAERIGKKLRIPIANFIYECPPWLEDIWGSQYVAENANPFSVLLWENTRRAYLGSRVLFPNSVLSKQYNSRWLDGMHVADPIHPGVDPDQMPFHATGAEPFSLSPHRDHLLFVGRLVESKNVHHLITAFHQLDSRAELHICGTGPELEHLKELACGSPYIHFHGFVADAILWSLFRQCRLVVYPTSFEGFGMPPMQALYFSKPCLASDLEVFRGIFKDKLEYFPIGDIATLAASIDRLLLDPEYCRIRGESGRQFILENFTWAIAAQRIEHSLIEAKHG